MATDKKIGEDKAASQNAVGTELRTPDPSYEPINAQAHAQVLQGKAGKTIQAVYHGIDPASFTYEGVEYSMERGFEYELPAGSDYVKNLVDQNVLVVNF